MLYTYIHHKEYEGVSQDVAHIYEHLVIYSFHAYLESLGIHPGLIGSVNGNTFEHIVFIHTSFYDKQVADAYEHFLRSPELVDLTLIPRMLLECEAEDKVTFTLQDRDKFNAQLKSLIAMTWVNNDSVVAYSIDETSTPEVVLQTKRAAKDFRNIALGYYVENDALDQDEQTFFLRFSVIVGDIVDFAIRKELHGSYCIDRAPVSIDGGTSTIMSSGTHLRLKKNVPLKLIKKTAEDALHAIDVKSAMPLIAAQFEEFADRATWRTLAIDYYRYTGILTNTTHISSLATPERVASIISKLKIHVLVMRKGDEEWFS
jgi:hypothetical protein